MAPPLDLKDLRNHSKRDPSGYHAEFLLQYRHFQTQLQIFLLKPAEDYKPFSDLVEYLCHVSDIYSKDMPDFPQQISNLLEKNCDILASPLRKSLVSALILLRSKNQITPHSTLSLFFKLFRVHDASLREMLYKHIVNDITNINKKHKNQNLNHALQNFMYTMMKDPSEIAAKQSLNVMIELYRKRIWNDAKTVNVISTGVFSKNTNVVVSTLKFFLTVAEDDEEDRIAEQKEKAALTIKKMNLKLNVKKMSKRERHHVEDTLAEAQLQKTPQRKLDPNWPAIELINDPAGYTEKVFGVCRHSFDRIEVRLMLMNFISRLIFTHKLLILNFYPFVQKYLMPKNEHVTYALSILAQCIHELVPPTDLQPVVKHLVDKFVHDKSSTESIVCGLHTLREMCNRNPLIMDETLLRDLAQYKSYKDRAVTAAARGLIAVYRTKNPQLLAKVDRGKEGNMNKEKPLEYGQVKMSSGVEGIEMLEAIEKIEQMEKQGGKGKVAKLDAEGNVIAFEDDSEEEDGEDGWMEVDSDDEEMKEGEGEGEEEGGEEEEGEEQESEDEEEIIVKTLKKKGAKGGVVPTVGVMSIADALKMQQTNMKIIEQQRAEQLKNREKRKRREEEDEDEEEEEDDEEDEDEEDEDDDEDEDSDEEAAEPEVDIWARIEMATAPQPPANGKTTSAKIAAAPKLVPTKSAPPAKSAATKSAPAKTEKPQPVQAKNAPATNGKSTLVEPAVKGKKAKVEEQNEKFASLPPKKRAKFEVVEESDDEEEDAEIEEIDSDEWEEVEDGEDASDDGEWVEMEDDESEEEEEVQEVKKPQKGNQEKKQKKENAKKKETTTVQNGTEKDTVQVTKANGEQRLDHVRILTEEDYEKLRRLQEMKAEGKISLAKLKEYANSLEIESEEEDEGGIVDPSSLTKGIKAPRKRGEERMAEVIQRRSQREKRSKEKTRLTTNTENTKRKNLMMIVKGKKQNKSKLSFRDRQMSQQRGKEKFKKRKHK